MLTVAVHPRRVAIIAAASAVGMWGFGGTLAKLTGMPGPALATYRMWLGFGVLALIGRLGGRRLTARGLFYAWPGGVAFALNISLFFSAVRRTAIANAALIAALHPAVMLVVARLKLGERVGVRRAVATAGSIAGVVVVIVGSASTRAWSPAGDLLAFGSLICWGGYWLATKRARAHVDTIEYLTWTALVGALVVTPIALATTGIPAPAARQWGLLAIMVLLPSTTGHLLMTWAHRYLPLSSSAPLSLIEPCLAPLAALVLLGEPLRLLQIAGGAAVLAGLAVVVSSKPAQWQPETQGV